MDTKKDIKFQVFRNDEDIRQKLYYDVLILKTSVLVYIVNERFRKNNLDFITVSYTSTIIIYTKFIIIVVKLN